MTILYIIIGVIVLLALWVIGTYNGFVRLTNQAKEAFSDIDVQLKRRADLIPNLVKTVKAYAKHESAVFTQVTKARSAMLSAKTMCDKAKADNMIIDALKSIFAVAEAYPALRASENFTNLQNQLGELENSLQSSRRFYNGAVRDLNSRAESFPSNLIANLFHVTKREFFAVDSQAERKSADVNLE